MRSPNETIELLTELTKRLNNCILGKVVLYTIDTLALEFQQQTYAALSKQAGYFRVYVDPESMKNKAVQFVQQNNLPVRFFQQPHQSTDKQLNVYLVCLDKYYGTVFTKIAPDELEEMLKQETEIINRLGVNIHYAGRCAPPVR